MAVSAELAREHIRSWCERLRRFPKSANWPAHLFHAADITNVIEILGNGRLVCRRDLVEIPCDVANQGALWNNPEAHGYVRLYFRPRTNFHLSTEGIKCLGDPYRRDAHMSIPVMLAFDAQAVLTMDGVCFSQGKLSKKRPVGSDDIFFRSINFDSVYHDGPIARGMDDDIQDRRMAEVVIPRVLPLRPFLRKVICRTALERRTLLHLLGTRAAEYSHVVTVEQYSQSTFLHRELYLTAVGFREGVLNLGFHAPLHPPNSGCYYVEVEHWNHREIVESWSGDLPADWSSAQFPGLRQGGGTWRICLEKVLAYEAPVPSEISVIR
jgi:ssDNA thymidine ADP-ribosyltransferase DarT-like protein